MEKNQYQFYSYTCFFQEFLRPSKQNLVCLKLSHYMCLFPELYVAVCILTHTKRHGQAPNVLAVFATQGCWSFISCGKCPEILFCHVCYLLPDQSPSLISFISLSKPRDYWNTKLIVLRQHFLPFQHEYKRFCLFSPFSAGFLTPFMIWLACLSLQITAAEFQPCFGAQNRSYS